MKGRQGEDSGLNWEGPRRRRWLWWQQGGTMAHPLVQVDVVYTQAKWLSSSCTLLLCFLAPPAPTPPTPPAALSINNPSPLHIDPSPHLCSSRAFALGRFPGSFCRHLATTSLMALLKVRWWYSRSS